MRTSSGSSPIAETWYDSTRRASRISAKAGEGAGVDLGHRRFLADQRGEEVEPYLVGDAIDPDLIVRTVKDRRHHVAQIAGVEYVGQQAARDTAGGFGEEAGRGQEPRGNVERHLFAFGEQAEKEARTSASRSVRRARMCVSVRRFSLALSIWLARGGADGQRGRSTGRPGPRQHAQSAEAYFPSIIGSYTLLVADMTTIVRCIIG